MTNNPDYIGSEVLCGLTLSTPLGFKANVEIKFLHHRLFNILIISVTNEISTRKPNP